MKKRVLFFVTLFALLFIYVDLLGQGDLGILDRNTLEQKYQSAWFKKNYVKYPLDWKTMENINLHEGKLKVLIFMGTWDRDSKKQLPRLLKITDSLNLAKTDITIYGLDKFFNSPQEIEKDWDVEYLPTIIFIANDIELGRIQEKPEVSLEDDFRYIVDIDLESLNPDSEKLDYDSEIYKQVDFMPVFPGCYEGSHKEREDCGKAKMLKFIYRNLKYPSIAREDGVQGMVVIQFVIDEHGWILNPQIVRDIGSGCGDAAKDVILKMNDLEERWVPGVQDDKKVKVLYTVPVKFKLEGID